MELPSFYEHSYGSSHSLYWAAASWAASQIYACKGEPAYAGYAAEYARLMLSCQETGNTGRSSFRVLLPGSGPQIHCPL